MLSCYGVYICFILLQLFVLFIIVLLQQFILCVIDSNKQSIFDIRSDKDDKSNYDRQYVAKLK